MRTALPPAALLANGTPLPCDGAATTYDPIDPNTGDPNGVSPARMYNLCGPLLLPEPNSPLTDPNSGTYLAGVRFVKD